MKPRLFTKNFTLIMVATVLGAAGGVAGNFALSFYVFGQTGSTLKTSLLSVVSILPSVVIPVIFSPVLDRLPRKPFLVAGDIVNGLIYLGVGFWLVNNEFNYALYMLFSVVLTSLSAFDSLAYNALFPCLIPKGCEEKGFSVSSMVYPVLTVIMSPVAALLLEVLGVGRILICQGFLSLVAAFTESFIDAPESHVKAEQENAGLSGWWTDLKDAFSYIRADKGLSSILLFSNYMNAVSFQEITVAFFSTAPGFSLTMYSFFTAAEFIGRSIGGIFCYRGFIKRKKRYSFLIFVYCFYEAMDALLLFLPYSFMLINRAACGFLGMNSGNIRYAAVQAYIPDGYRARINALSDAAYCVVYSVMNLLIGLLGEVMDYRFVAPVITSTVILLMLFTVCKHKKEVTGIICFDHAQNKET